MKNNTLLPYLMAVLAMAFWGMSYIWVKIVYLYIGPMSTVIIRLFFAAIIMTLIALVLRIPIFPKKEDIKAFLLLAFLEPFAYFIGESLGLQYVSSSIGSLIISTIPLFIPIFAFLFLHEKVSRQTLIGLVISFFGVSLLILNKDFTFDASPLGVMLMFLAVIAGALYTIQLKKLLGKYNPATLVIHMNAFGFVYFLPLFLYFEYNDFVQVEFDSRLIITLAELVIFSSVGALYFFSHAVEKIGVSKSSLFTNLIPVITAIAAWIILPDESLDLKLATGIVIVLFGVFIGQDRKNKRRFSLFRKKRKE